MTKVNDDILLVLYQIMSVQTLLDMKQTFGEITMECLYNFNNSATASFEIKNDCGLLAVMFVFDAKEVYNVIIYTTNAYTKNKDDCIKLVKDNLNSLSKKKEINSIVYKHARQIKSLFASIGFMVAKEKEKHLVLEYKNE